jgi:hypothetical protein
MSRWLICVLVTLAASVAVHPSVAADVEALEIIEFGLYRADVTGRRDAPLTITGRVSVVGDAEFYSHTDRVPARQGVRFGTRFRLIGSPSGQSVAIRSAWRIPEPGIRNPKTGKLYRESISDTRVKLGSTRLLGFTFSLPGSVICGDWVQEAWWAGQKLLSQIFVVEGCADVPVSQRPVATPAG